MREDCIFDTVWVVNLDESSCVSVEQTHVSKWTRGVCKSELATTRTSLGLTVPLVVQMSGGQEGRRDGDRGCCPPDDLHRGNKGGSNGGIRKDGS